MSFYTSLRKAWPFWAALGTLSTFSGCASAVNPARHLAAKPSAPPSQPTPKRADKTPYDERDIVQQFARDLAKQSAVGGSSPLNEQDILATLAQARYQGSAAKAILPPISPSVKNWQRYRARFVETYRIKRGIEFWDAHADILAKTQEATGVPASVITAIIGVETIYGEHTGNYRTIDALATLAFDYPPSPRDRSDFFKSELAAFFMLCKEAHLDPLTIRGSFAGAIGLGQFMPSSWRAFAVDGNGDGTIDLFGSVDDAIASVGQFLMKHGWVKGGPWYGSLRIEDPSRLAALIDNDVIPKYTMAELSRQGISSDTAFKPGEKLAIIDLPNGLDSVEYRLGTQNFYTVTRYNRSSFYALSVMELAQAIDQTRQALAYQAGKTPVDK